MFGWNRREKSVIWRKSSSEDEKLQWTLVCGVEGIWLDLSAIPNLVGLNRKGDKARMVMKEMRIIWLSPCRQ